MKPLKMLVGALALLSLSAQAKTVALWPLESVDAEGGLRCVIDPRNDLSVIAGHKSNTDTAVVWELPPNPDTDRHAAEPINRTAVHEQLSGGSVDGFLYNNYSGVYMRRDKDFTVEGYIKVLALPASNTWGFVVGAYGEDYSNNNTNRWMLSLRRRSAEDYACSWILWGFGTSDTVLYRYADEEASYAITNTWIHVALVHEARSGSQDHGKLYLDGVV